MPARLLSGKECSDVKLGIIGRRKSRQCARRYGQARRGAEVSFTSKQGNSAREAAERAKHGSQALEMGALADGSEIILLTLPFSEIETALTPVRDRLAGKILVDVTNPISKDHRDLIIGHTDSGAERIGTNLPNGAGCQSVQRNVC